VNFMCIVVYFVELKVEVLLYIFNRNVIDKMPAVW